MRTTRRDFLRLCRSAAVGLTAAELLQVEKALANPSGPTVLWLQGASCTGCSVSFLNRISTSAPYTAADVLIQSINLTYHPNLMAAAGDSAASIAMAAYNAGNYVLAVEGGVPTAFGGNTCWAWSLSGKDTTFLDAVTTLASRAKAVLSVGTCASWGGIPAAPPNPTGVKGVQAATLKKTINIAGCPPHPDWIIWVIARLLAGSSIALDSYGRPAGLFNRTVHDQCPRKETDEVKYYGVDNRCLKALGCLGPDTIAPCPAGRWNNGVNWCVDANSLCIGCTNPSFPVSHLRNDHA